MGKSLLIFSLVFGIIQPIGSVQIWRGLKPSKTFDFMVLEDFEQKIPWQIKTKQAIQAYGRFVKKEPIFPAARSPYKKEINAFFNAELDHVRKSAALHNRPPIKDPTYSYEVQCFFSNPGRDVLDIAPPLRVGERLPPTISGRPRAFAIWVFGVNKKHSLYAIFSNVTGKRYRVLVSQLNFYGWERLEVTLPPYIQRRNPRNSNRFDFKFHGLRIASHASAEPGLFLFNFDMVVVMIDRSFSRYAGSQIKDNWD